MSKETSASVVAHKEHRDPANMPVADAPSIRSHHAHPARTAVAVSGFASLLLLMLGLVAVGHQSIVPFVLLTLSASLASGACLAMVSIWPAASAYGAGYADTDLEDRIERLEDLRWQARDNADRLQALLDGQADIILKRDTSGKIVFANRTFCNMFAVQLEDVLKKPFHPEVVARCHDAMPSENAAERFPCWARPSIEKVETIDGARWIEWSHRWLDDPQTSEAAIQSVGRDVTNQRLHEAALARARDEARAADRAKSRFLASMSHEIRTPMNGILGMSGLLSETAQSPEQRTYTQAVRKSAVTLLELIDEILDFSKIEAGHVELASAPVDIVECVQSAVELLAPRTYQKRLQLAWSIAPDMPRHVLGDETRLRQILLNLIGNAVKFTEEGGISIWVGAEPAENNYYHIQVVIRDTGPGLSDEAQARIFMEFERAVPNEAQHESGTGLGLAIAQRLAQSMGGSISVASRPGAGATFTLAIRLPRAEQASLPSSAFDKSLEHRNVAIVSSQQIERRTLANLLRAHDFAVTEFACMREFKRWSLQTPCDPPDTILLDILIDPDEARQCLDRLGRTHDIDTAMIGAASDRADFERFRAVGIDRFLVRPIRPATLLALMAGKVDQPAAQQATPSAIAPRQTERATRRILVAEDNEINALLARTVLERLGCEPIVVPNGQEAVDAVARVLAGQAPPLDAILMDLHMPIINGLDATAKIRELCEDGGMPCPTIIAVTANAFQEDRERCLAAGMDDYLPKPFEPGDLRRVLEGLPNSIAG
ncbi:MAG: response regulator [Hyphomicrobiaceae bacterium]